MLWSGLSAFTALNAAEPVQASASPDASGQSVEIAARELVDPCKGVWTAPVGEVVASGCDMAGKANGPLLGNGHVGVELSGTPEQQRFHIAKNDFWTHNSGKILDCPRALTVGGVSLEFPELKDAATGAEIPLTADPKRSDYLVFGTARGGTYVLAKPAAAP
jgi:hypothetical protein